MRKDMQKVIHERGKTSGGSPLSNQVRRSRGKRIDAETASDRESMKPADWRERRQSQEMLGPIKRYLRSNVGRPWNSVWSDICRRFPSATKLGSEFRDNLSLWVELNVVEVEGELFDSRGYSIKQHYYNCFFVHPKLGTLCFQQTIPEGLRKKKQ